MGKHQAIRRHSRASCSAHADAGLEQRSSTTFSNNSNGAKDSPLKQIVEDICRVINHIKLPRTPSSEAQPLHVFFNFLSCSQRTHRNPQGHYADASAEACTPAATAQVQALDYVFFYYISFIKIYSAAPLRNAVAHTGREVGTPRGLPGITRFLSVC